MRKLIFNIIALYALILLNTNTLLAQSTCAENLYFVSNDNYVDINTNRLFNDVTGIFNIPIAFNSSEAKKNEYKYLLSSMRLAERIRFVFNRSSNDSLDPANAIAYTENYPNTNINPNNFAITKTPINSGYTNYSPIFSSNQHPSDLTQNRLHMVVIRPNDNIRRPCIMLTNGASENFRTQWTGTLLLAADLALRGYAVCIYENLFSSKNEHMLPFIGGGVNALNNIVYLNNFEKKNAISSLNMAHVTTAALQYIINYSNLSIVNIDTNKIYSVGASAGAAHSLVMAYADDNATYGNNNYNNTSFGQLVLFGGTNDLGKSVRDVYGSFTSKSLFPNNNYRNRIKGIVSMAGGLLPQPQPYIGSFLDVQDAICPALFLHVIRDHLVDIYLSSTANGNNINGLLGPANPTLTGYFNQNNIKFHTYIFCDTLARHTFAIPSATGDLNPTYMNLTNSSTTNAVITNSYNSPNTNTTVYSYMKHFTFVGLQMLSTGKIVGDFLKKSTSSQITNNIRNYVKTITPRNPTMVNNDYFPSIANTSYPNGKFINPSIIGITPGSWLPQQDGCIEIPNTTFGGWLFGCNPYPSGSTGSSSGKFASISTTNAKLNNLPLLYPNPTNGKFSVNIPVGEDIYEYSIHIFSIDGRSVFTKSYTESIEKDNYIQQQFDISNQPNGIYYIRAISSDKVLLNKAISLQK